MSAADADSVADRFGLVGKRVVAGSVVGIAAAVVARVEGASWAVTALCAADFAALVFIVWVWITLAGPMPQRRRETRACSSSLTNDQSASSTGAGGGCLARRR